MKRIVFNLLVSTGVVAGLFPILASGSIIQSNSSNNTSQTFFPCSTADLINAGQPTFLSMDPVTSPQYGNPSALNNGGLGGVNSIGDDGVGRDSPWTETFTLDTSVNTNGYTITNIATFAAWQSDRVTQRYDLYFAYQGDPTPGKFYAYGTYVLFYNNNGDPYCSTKIELTDTTGVIASNVCAIRLAFGSGGAIYREIDVLGVPTATAYVPPVIPNVYVSTNGSHTPPFDTWDKAATNIQAAIDVGLNKIVLVSNGTYNLTSALVITNNVVMRSVNGADNTVLRRDSGTTALLSLNYVDALFDGFTLREGNIGAVTLNAGTLQNCMLVSNTCSSGLNGSAINMGGGTVRNCSFLNNYGAYYGAIGITGFGTVSNCIFSGNSANYDGGAVHFYQWSSGQIISCIMSNNTAGRWGGGVGLEGGGSPRLIRNCLISGNSSVDQGGGIAVFETAAEIDNCTIVSNSAGAGAGYSGYGPLGGGGVWISYNSTGLRMTNSIAYFNTAASGGNNIANVGIGVIGFSCAPELTEGIDNNLSADPKFMDTTNGNWHLNPNSPCIDAGVNLSSVSNDLDGIIRPFDGNNDGTATTDMGAYESTNTAPYGVAVSASATTGSNSLQVVFTAHVTGPSTNADWYGWDFYNTGSNDLSGSNLQVVTNFYATPGLYSINLAVSNNAGNAASITKIGYIRVYSAGGIAYVSTNGASLWPYDTWERAATNIQDAVDVGSGTMVLVSNGTYNVASAISLNNGTVLRSVNGLTNTIVRRSSGSGQVVNMSLYDGANVTNATLDGFTIREGTISATIMNAGTIQNCLFASNTCSSGAAGSAVIVAGGTVRNCNFLGNYGAYYGAVHITGFGTVSNCVFSGNSANFDGGGVHIHANAGGNILSCIITNNSVGRWGGGVEFDNNSNPCLVRNCLIAGNSSGQQAGGISAFSSSCIIESCTIVSNSANTIPGAENSSYGTLGGGGLWMTKPPYTCNLRMSNCIVYFNTASQTNNIAAVDFSIIKYSCSPDLSNGIDGNVTADPQFTDLDHGDYHLKASSACLNAGLNLPWMTGSSDLAGNQRILFETVDMGAYESYPQGSIYAVR